MKIRIKKNGPYVVTGNIPIKVKEITPNEEGFSNKYTEKAVLQSDEEVSLCRCGRSKNMPYCDGSHKEFDFDGTETASKEAFFDKAEVIEGPYLELYDYEDLCSYARFCDKPRRAWTMAYDPLDEKETELAIEEACNCSSGRLVVKRRDTGEIIEPKLEKEISVLEDPAIGVSGPLYVEGGIEIESEDGTSYEIRNRQTICRCGESSNKPFCNGAHASCKFKDDFLEEQKQQ